ncbi:MATE family efflux transporter [Algoriphagus halophytocola]|uniref:Multidrug-efflux transporter n=1 Tax=Algoriphagus halophytocola TaxID=2991499 RepID=A0ABY6MN07_9BACT|nr:MULTISPECIES: MATE family efflux transporter [unclassified Algoriphagus]UZD23711.1 MATE family efflux transporter [Algoriphagus sp. TR-M5]WBL45005.1 MATE family efflux transporter [Algoriphagus sp. TR-M9]
MTIKDHFKTTFTLAFPVVLSQLGQVLVGVADSMMVGRLGAVPLAAASLGNSIFFVIMMFGMGISMGITPLVSVAEGKGKFKRIGHLFQHGLWINITTAILLTVVVVGLAQGLHFLDQPEEVVKLTVPYLFIITASLLPFMIFQSFKQLAEGISQTKQAMYVTILCNLVNVFLNWVLIYGNLGAPEMGLNGAGLATLISRVMMPFAMGIYVMRSKRYRVFNLQLGIGKLRFLLLNRILKIGVPTGFQYIFEVSAFSTAAIMMGWIGVNALAAHQIAINLASVSYMMVSGLSTAGMIRVSNQIGRANFKSMREAGMVVFGMVLVFMAITGLIFILMRFYLPTLYIDNAEVIALSASLLIIAGMFQLSDGIQVAGLGVLRGMEDVRFPTLITLVAYWVIGLPLGYILAFKLGFAERGIWYGLLIGLSVTAVVLFYRFHKLSNRMIQANDPAVPVS